MPNDIRLDAMLTRIEVLERELQASREALLANDVRWKDIVDQLQAERIEQARQWRLRHNREGE